jgi:RNA-splicing ligase RtcB
MIAVAKTALKKCRMIDIWHNNVERIAWPPSELWSAGKYASSIYNIVPCDCVYIHRKGAAPTYDPKIQLPLSLLPLPGSRGTPTLILQPTFSTSNAWGLKNGAGCAMSRAKALSASAQKYKGQNILEPRLADLQGTWVICDEKGLVFEEAPDAYKDVQAVSQDLVDADAAQVVGWCRSRISYKVRNETC